MKPNPGHCPEEAVGKRVRVVLEKDRATMRQPTYADALTPVASPGWAADGRGGCRWTIKQRNYPRGHDIAFYEVI